MGFLSDATRYAKRLASTDEPMDSEDELTHVEENMEELNEHVHNLRLRYVIKLYDIYRQFISHVKLLI